MKHMVDALIFARLFVGGQISRRLHHHDRPVIPLLVPADRTELIVRQRTTLLTVADMIPGAHHRLGELFNLLLWHVDQMKRQSLS